ncbi:extracellular solute-binding protein [Halarchaeum nitratireducens]|uniref:Iron ABC transporter substrate-binding protein n=1 Tax=Halarchaeum nitratireducens TaxID=489913 RepID=A0A830G8D1_9EURY|nr:extracellular solute-binding protein [Halarchaeum nitratireducens]GGN09897.1 iron ABC transporter substrate-binding protein [Halarchaeum nitratireducens]
MDHSTRDGIDDDRTGLSRARDAVGDRRSFLQAVGASAGILGLAGCSGGGTDGETTSETTTDGGSSTSTSTSTVPEPKTYAEDELFHMDEWRGDGPQVGERPTEYTGLSVLDLPNLRGEITVYLGGGEGGLYEDAMQRIQNLYRDFTVYIRTASSSQLANTIIEEANAGQSPADVFWAIDAGSVGVVAENGATVTLPDHVTQSVADTYHPTDEWVGIMGRARSIPFNTNEFDADGIPDKVAAFPDDPRFEDEMGWAPTYGAFQAFITAMRELNGREATKQWLEAMQDHGVRKYGNEFQVANAVASGELSAGFSNHYYSRLVYEERPDAPLELAFTNSDAGALVNCSGAQVIKNSADPETAANFIHHLLSIELQEFLGTRGFGYPLLSSVPPVGNLPTIDQLNPPELDLSKLANVEPTLDLLREVGAL